MYIYLDGVIFLNFFFDFILLLNVSLLLKRNVSILNIILGSIIGSLSIFILFFDILGIYFKIIISILMIITTFGFKGFLKNLIYLYFLIIILGGFLYMINNSFDIHNGLVFYSKGVSINIILILISTPILLKIYIKKLKEVKKYNDYYKVSLYIKDKVINLTSYLDTGNMLKSPYSNKPILLINNKDPIFNELSYNLIPYNTIDNKGFIKCFKAKSLYIEGIGIRYNFLIGLIDNNIHIDGIDSILNKDILEGK